VALALRVDTPVPDGVTFDESRPTEAYWPLYAVVSSETCASTMPSGYEELYPSNTYSAPDIEDTDCTPLTWMPVKSGMFDPDKLE
jgi:hypothetical protein